MARGVMREKLPAIGWAAQAATLVANEYFENYGNVTTEPDWWGNEWSQMTEGDPGNFATFTIGGGGACSAFAPFCNYGGSWAMNILLGGPATGSGVTDWSGFVRHTYTGLPASTACVVSAYSGFGFGTGGVGHQAPLGIRCNGIEATHAVQGSWVKTTISTTTSAGGDLTIDAGFFHVVAATSGIGIQRLAAVDNIEVNLASIPAASDELLLFSRPFDNANTWVIPRRGSQWDRTSDGLYSALVGKDYLLGGLARWIPRTAGVGMYSAYTPWDGDPGTNCWSQFIAHARDKHIFTYYPDQTNLATSYQCQLVEPMSGPPEPEGNTHWRQPLTLRSLSGPFVDY